jgi:L-ascorbate metabolism protein UlaG (beta-lactamase superfamily)
VYALLGLTGAAAGIALIRCRTSLRGHTGPPTDHFDGERFHNIRRVEQGAFDFWKWQLTRETGPWREWVAADPGPQPPERVTEGIRITFINHATLLIQTDGRNILTDPIWSERCSPAPWAGPRRHRPPGIRFEDLPPIDLVVISHDHYDHLDLPTLRDLAQRHRPVILTGLGNWALLQRAGIDAELAELDWWESHRHDGSLELHFVPARHFSARGICDRNATLWGGWMISGPSGRVLFAGDSGWDDHFRTIRERLGAPDVALLPIGAFRPRWFMAPVHISPDEAIDAHEALGASVTVPMHYGTFFLGDDGETEAVETLRRAVAARGLDDEFVILDFGESFSTPAKS